LHAKNAGRNKEKHRAQHYGCDCRKLAFLRGRQHEEHLHNSALRLSKLQRKSLSLSVFKEKRNSVTKDFTFFAPSDILYCVRRRIMRIWAKLMEDGHIKKDYVYHLNEKLTYSHFFDYLTEICLALDIPTPVLTKTHIFNFAKFNHVKFLPRDFVESLGYDYLFLENLF
jgi:hypothetical protein